MVKKIKREAVIYERWKSHKLEYISKLLETERGLVRLHRGGIRKKRKR